MRKRAVRATIWSLAHNVLGLSLWVISASAMQWVIWAIVDIALAIWAGTKIGQFAEERGLNKGSFVFLGLVWPIAALIFVLNAKDRQTDTFVPSARVKGVGSLGGDLVAKCPWCAEQIKLEAKICRYCTRSVDSEFAELRSKLAKRIEVW